MALNIGLLKIRGKESTTLTFVTISWAILQVKFLISGIKLGSLGVQQLITAAEFGAATALILGIWLTREWKAKSDEKKENIDGMARD